MNKKHSSNLVIDIANVWKIFGHNAQQAMEAIQKDQIGKQELLENFNAVIGVADVSLQINRGEIFCIMGLSGSGKSTLVRHINRLLEPTSGEINVDGINVLSLAPKELQQFRNQKIGMVFQNFALLPHRSVFDNIALPLDIRKITKNERLAIAQNVLSLVELDGWGHKFAHELSGGMQQRVGLARAIAANPDILLMDEPFSALDPLIRRQLQDQFIELAAVMKKTTVFITHDLDEAVRIGDRIAIMRDGRVVQIGTAEDIVMHPADSYVADFVAGISRLKIVTARSIMQPLEQYQRDFGALNQDSAQVKADESFNNLVRLSMDNDLPLSVSEQDKIIGVITRKDILQIVMEEAKAA